MASATNRAARGSDRIRGAETQPSTTTGRADVATWRRGDDDLDGSNQVGGQAAPESTEVQKVVV
ncbi:uncharacterized protein N7482_007357 [Penicillium canariense]|uniref:Uncharacterized protein n=1 Tax=Penicillium canariense TaxID=189055 RepID=A0A9W9LK83_9EURO|nr:uncharacterized protein N7482_007357 [Penicillium canariense]KAJ5160353.1 hypothetical protein N7482_007357 [Penicillium canariense]